MTQQVIVFLIVAAAAGYAAWKLLPRAATRRMLSFGMRFARRAGIPADRLARWEARGAATACGACDACAGCSDPVTSTATPAGGRIIALQRVESR